MPLDGYMYFEGPGLYKVGVDKKTEKSLGKIKGETLDARFQEKGAFQIRNFTWECERTSTSTSTTGDDGNVIVNTRGDSTVNVKAFNVKKEIDLATPTLFLASVTGCVFKGAHVYFRKTTGAKLQTFFHAIFSDVILEKWAINLDGEDASEQMSFAFDWVEVNYYPQTREGARKKDNPANMKQYCTSNPDNSVAPDIFKRENKVDLQEGDRS
jgi:type VI protein secretion system component Hcp